MKVLITGGTGLIGNKLTQLLKQNGHEVSLLSRSPKKIDGVKVFGWDITKGEIDQEAVHVDVIIHLAGANVGEKRWANERKKVITASRVDAAQLLLNACKEEKVKLKAFISASGISCYPTNTDKFYSEEEDGATGFLADVVHDWELAADRFSEISQRVVKLRTGVVLSEKGGALEKIAATIKAFVGAPLGSGEQYIPWVHEDDIANAYFFSLENENLNGAYNVVADQKGTTNKALTKAVAKVLGRPLILPNVPSFVLKMMMGEMSEIALTGMKVSNKKITDAGFHFEFTDLDKALKHIYA